MPGTAPLGAVNPGNLVDANGTLLFSAYDSGTGAELWKSDGTVAGTVLVRDLTPVGDWTQGSSPAGLSDVNGTLFFTASDGVTGAELWKSDASAAGTVLVKDIRSGEIGSGPDALTSVDGTLFFTADDGTAGRELWKSDGNAAGTGLVKDIMPGAGTSRLAALTAANGHLFFFANDGTTGVELWRSDGTAGGTALVKDICQGGCGQLLCESGCGRGDGCVCAGPRTRIADVSGMLFFTASGSPPSGPFGLWKTDGTDSGTVRISAEEPFFPDPSSLTVAGDTVFFTDVLDGSLWVTDGSAAGTVRLHPDELYSVSSLTAVNGTLFFTANDASSLWKSDGTAAGTVLVKPIWAESLTDVNGTKASARGGHFPRSR